jgi:hypothetical protein
MSSMLNPSLAKWIVDHKRVLHFEGYHSKPGPTFHGSHSGRKKKQVHVIITITEFYIQKEWDVIQTNTKGHHNYIRMALQHSPSVEQFSPVANSSIDCVDCVYDPSQPF